MVIFFHSLSDKNMFIFQAVYAVCESWGDTVNRGIYGTTSFR
jgi:hypothetical protein